MSPVTRPDKSPEVSHAMPAKNPVSIYQLKVTLKHSKPPIWRRIQVRSDTTLYKFHHILQIAMGWTNSHLHQFIADGVYYGEPDPDFDFAVVNEKRTRLNQIMSDLKDKCIYEYDFGDRLASATPGRTSVSCASRRPTETAAPTTSIASRTTARSN